ncbi:conserved hypothetical protein [Nostocoides japonicum T1-X7]|uniref:Mycothiol-dependent maleylpyruvate isomerase metal-binding domain-containing protein n=1 Tax=Nostocoides japonicum T1-X7 TaxID=1194083 RepID=A0A077M8L2_9MICO|nr:TIGR03086 family metal-binding protein [Tetrasphaera japonica]CCH80370.1 conserved hypothetical protein [Tetrasphaera japonica T1-X7]
MDTTATTQTPTTIPDLRPVLARALDQAGRLVTSTDPSDASRPTPCDEYDVAALVDHLQAVVRRIGAVVRGEPFFSVPREWHSEDWAADWVAGRAGTDSALAGADLERVVDVPWGQAPVGAALGMYVSELATHAWDLAVATGRTAGLDDELAAISLTGAMDKLPREGRGPEIPFGPVVDVPQDAPAYDRLVGWNGRDPRWTP